MRDKPSIILLSIDSLRYDCVAWAPVRPHLEALGIDGPPATPELDRLVAGAYCFTQAIANAPYTTSSHASILTGLVPPQHGVRAFMRTALGAAVPTLPEMLARAGYRTLLMSDVPRFLNPVGLARGFEQVVSDPEQALAWWGCYPDSPRFMLLHYLDVHLPYGFSKSPADDEINSRWLAHNRARIEPRLGRWFSNGRFDYGGCKKQLHAVHRGIVQGEDGLRRGLEWYLDGLAWFDAHRLRSLVRRLEELAAIDRSIIVVFGDHGEGHDPTSCYRLGHACLMFDDVIRVPLAIRHPDSAAGARPGDFRAVGGQCSLADLTPTLLDFVGELGRWERPEHPWTGRSLVPRSAGERNGWPAYAEYWSRFLRPGSNEMEWTLRQRIVRTSRHKLSLIGRQTNGIRDWAELPAEAFAAQLYADVLGRHASAEDVARRARWARWGGGLGRWVEYQRVRHSREARQIPKIALYDLPDDPLERAPQPIDAAGDAERWAHEMLDAMEAIDRNACPGEPLEIANGERSLIEARLAELGYLD